VTALETRKKVRITRTPIWAHRRLPAISASAASDARAVAEQEEDQGSTPTARNGDECGAHADGTRIADQPCPIRTIHAGVGHQALDQDEGRTMIPVPQRSAALGDDRRGSSVVSLQASNSMARPFAGSTPAPAGHASADASFDGETEC
jgi:hypothetical protein